MADMRISELMTAAGLHDGDLFETSQTDSISSSGYASYKTSLSAIAAFIAKQVQFSGDLQTTSKNLIGAINEVFNAGTSVTVTNVIPATETTKRVATITVDGVAKDINADDTVKVITDLKTPKNATITNGIAQFECIEENLVKGLKVTMSPIQSGSGDPSPTNIRPISGRTEASVKRTGKNWFDKTDTSKQFAGYIGSTSIVGGSAGRLIVYIPCFPNMTYTVSRKRVSTNERFSVAYTTELPADSVSAYGVISAQNSGSVGDLMSLTITTGENASYLAVWAYWGGETTALDTLQIELGSTATAYEPYTAETHTHQYSDTIYGGVDDFVNGGLDNEYELFEPTIVTTVAQSSGLWYWAFSLPKTSTNPLSTNGLMSSHFNPTNQVLAIGNCYITANGTLLLCVPSDQTLNTGALVNAWLAENDLQFAYKPATATTVSTSAEEITTVSGTNIISGTEPISECKYTELATVDDLIKIIGGQ